MDIKVFKFGGASVQDASGVKNVAVILRKFADTPVITVVSAMGKTTNALEDVLNYYLQQDTFRLIEAYNTVKAYHQNILNELFPDKNHFVFKYIDSLFDQLRGYIRKGHLYSKLPSVSDYDFEYDQIVSFGELFSSSVLYYFLLEEGLNVAHLDVRELIKTDRSYRDARVDWKRTSPLIKQTISRCFSKREKRGAIALTQGFLGSDPDGNTTTLGREGSDFTAAIFAWSLQIKEMTIWKDVPGIMNADPKWMKNTVKLDSISYREAIELAYYGASVIHPKTIKPLENANIVLRVKSFFDPESQGTAIENLPTWNIPLPIFIRKQNQVLISLSTRDFSFILEENLSQIFNILANFRVKVNVMQHSAISFSICVDADPIKIPRMLSLLKKEYQTRYNEGLELITIRHYQPETQEKYFGNRIILMEQKSRNTLQVVMEKEEIK